MGACFSLNDAHFEHSLRSSSPTAKVISVNGTLLQYPTPIAVSQVLNCGGSPSSSFFICNSDLLNYDEYIPALESDHQLEPDQIYFILPVAKLQRRLTASDMAAFAVRASLALQNPATSENNQMTTRRRKHTRVSPVFFVKSEPRFGGDYPDDEFRAGPYQSLVSKKKAAATEKSGGLGVTRSGSVKKLQRYTSKRVLRRAVRSFKLRLAPIQEGSEQLVTCVETG